jgi:hypothetical protein
MLCDIEIFAAVADPDYEAVLDDKLAQCEAL